MSEGDGMVEVTEGDREKAAAMVAEWTRGGENVWLTAAIAKALADEREKARAPFLRVMRQIPPDSPELRWVADRIQRAAEESE